MTAKSRRRKLDKRRKSDEHPQPRRHQEAARPEEGTRVIRDARIQSLSLVPEGEGFPGSYIELVKEAQSDYVLTNEWKSGEAQDAVQEALADSRRVTQWGTGYSIQAGDEEGLTPLNVIDSKDYDFIGTPDGTKFYVNDSEKELLDEGQRIWEERRSSKEAVRTAGASDE